MIFPNPRFKALDISTGAALAAGQVFFYLAGTSTPATVYQDQALSAAHPQPVELDGAGEAEIWLDPAVSYKVVLADAYSVVIWTVDGIQVAEAARLTTLTVTGATTLAALTVSGQITSTVATGTAPLIVASTTKVANLNADLLDGKDWAAPDPIGSTTPKPGTFAADDVANRALLAKAIAGQTEDIFEVQDSAGAELFAIGADGSAEIAGDLQVEKDMGQLSPNGALWTRGQVSEEITLDVGAVFTDSVADMLPANSIIEAVVARITETITTAANWSLGDSAQVARFLASTTDLVLDTTKVGLAHANPTVATADLGPVQTAAAKLRITLNANPGAGKLRITVFYRQFVAPTS